MRFAYQTKATGKISHISTIHMFIKKLNSKQKQLKTVQEFILGNLSQHQLARRG